MHEPIRSSYHTHSHYCDGQGQISEMIEAAIAAGLTEVGISSHAPLPFETEWTMPPERLADYVKEVHQLQERYHDRIRVLFGAEIDFIPGSGVAAYQEQVIFPLGFDYFVGSVHFLGRQDPPRSFDGTEQEFREILRDDYDGDIEAMAVDYYHRIRQVPSIPGVKIIGHLDLIKRWNAERTYFTGNEPWDLAAIEETLQSIAASGLLVELNTAGWRKGLGEPYPSLPILTRCHDLGIPVTVNSDAHTPGDVAAGFEQARSLLVDIGIVPVSLA
ncbi:MAG TPA: histidinol-phosphatase [Nitrolancea sp.]|nr:histidinol-phosphatase [Nitrolancea sp.]